MQLTKQQVNTILDNAPKGVDKTKILDGLITRGYDLEGIDTAKAKESIYARNPELAPKVVEPSILSKIGTDLSQRGKNLSDIAQLKSEGKTGLGELVSKVSPALGEKVNEFAATHPNVVAAVNAIAPAAGVPDIATAGQVAGGVQDIIGQTLSAITPESVKQLGAEKIKELAQTGFGKAGIDTMEKYNQFAKENPLLAKNVEGLANIGLTVGDIVGAGETASAVSNVAKKVATGTLDAAKTVAEQAGKGFAEAGTKLTATKESLLKSLAPEVDAQVKTVLKTAPAEKFDKFVQVATKASTDATAPSVYEEVANSLTDSTKQLDSQVKSLGGQKAEIIGKAKTGLADFSKETGQTILDIQRKVKTPTGKSFIQKLKTVTNKAQADKAIDELQDILYKGNRDLTIPTGSKEDRVLKGILGEYNSKLKSTLPKSYQMINDKIAVRKQALNILNKALGETVDGVPTRGAGLIKQFFSPAGTKAKELFAFIKKETGVDLAQDAVLAKYIGDAFGDVKVRSLLENVPTTKSGFIDSAIEFGLDKTGISGKFKESTRAAKLQKAKDLINKP